MPYRRLADLSRRVLFGAVLLLPVAAMIGQFYWHGLLYTFGEGEVWFAHMQARNMLDGDPSRTLLLTDDTFALGQETPALTVYTHNPWLLPRLACAGCFLCGMPNILVQNLIVCLALYGVSLLCLRRLWPGASWPVLLFLCFLHLDYYGFLRPSFNLGRAWQFPLLFGCLASLTYRGRLAYLAPGVAFFLLWQFEVTFAVFTCTAAAIFLLVLATRVPERCGAWRRVSVGTALGSALSLAFFLGQLLLYYGPDGLWADLTQTLHARNNHALEAAPRPFVDIVQGYAERFRVWALPMDFVQAARQGAAALVAHHGTILAGTMFLGVLAGVVLLARRRGDVAPDAADTDTRLLAGLLLAGLAGAAAAALVLRGETFMIYLYNYHPMLVFLAAPAAALGAWTLARLGGRVPIPQPNGLRTAAAAGLCAVLLTAQVQASETLFHRYRQLDGELFWVLSRPPFRGQRLVVPWPAGAMDRIGLVIENLTGVPPRFVDEGIEQGVLPSGAAPEYLLYVHHWYWNIPSCGAFCADMEELGHRTVLRGRRFAILEIAHRPAVRGPVPWEERCEPPEPSTGPEGEP